VVVSMWIHEAPGNIFHDIHVALGENRASLGGDINEVVRLTRTCFSNEPRFQILRVVPRVLCQERSVLYLIFTWVRNILGETLAVGELVIRTLVNFLVDSLVNFVKAGL
jgi:hypothetical protein